MARESGFEVSSSGVTSHSPTRKRLRQGRRKAFHLYHVCNRGEICFEDMAPAIGCGEPKQCGSVVDVVVQGAILKIFYLLFFCCWALIDHDASWPPGCQWHACTRRPR